MADQTELGIETTDKQEIEQSGAERTRERVAFVPPVDIYETADAVVVVADMPGVDDESVDITLENGVLTINGYVSADAPHGLGLAHCEYRIGDFQRSFTISNKIDRDRIEATLRDGVLRLYLPKAEPAQRKISVTTG